MCFQENNGIISFLNYNMKVEVRPSIRKGEQQQRVTSGQRENKQRMKE
jgi:hypothetical protein